MVEDQLQAENKYCGLIALFLIPEVHSKLNLLSWAHNPAKYNQSYMPRRRRSIIPIYQNLGTGKPPIPQIDTCSYCRSLLLAVYALKGLFVNVRKIRDDVSANFIFSEEADLIADQNVCFGAHVFHHTARRSRTNSNGGLQSTEPRRCSNCIPLFCHRWSPLCGFLQSSIPRKKIEPSI